MKKVTKENSKPLNEIVESGIPGTYVPTEDGSYQKVDDMDADDLYEEAMAEIEIEDAHIEATEDAPTAKAYEVQYIPLYKGGSEEENRVKHLHRFYTVELAFDKYSGCTKIKKIELDNFAIINVLRDLGFYRYDQPNGTFEYVKIENNIITLLRDPQVIIDAFEDFVRNIPTLYYRTDDAPEVVKKDEEKCIKCGRCKDDCITYSIESGKEGEKILPHLKGKVVAMAIEGKKYSSQSFAKEISSFLVISYCA